MTPTMESPGASARPTTPAGPSSEPRPSVIFVREWEQQMSSSGCCGRVEGDFLDFGSAGAPHTPSADSPELPDVGARRSEGSDAACTRERVFAERRRKMEEVGVLYRAVRERFGDDVKIRVVDPRNLLSLIPMVWQEGRRHEVPVGERLRSLLRLSVNMVIVNGRVTTRNEWPDPAELLELVGAHVGEGGPDPDGSGNPPDSGTSPDDAEVSGAVGGTRPA